MELWRQKSNNGACPLSEGVWYHKGLTGKIMRDIHQALVWSAWAPGLCPVCHALFVSCHCFLHPVTCDQSWLYCHSGYNVTWDRDARHADAVAFKFPSRLWAHPRTSAGSKNSSSWCLSLSCTTQWVHCYNMSMAVPDWQVSLSWEWSEPVIDMGMVCIHGTSKSRFLCWVGFTSPFSLLGGSHPHYAQFLLASGFALGTYEACLFHRGHCSRVCGTVSLLTLFLPRKHSFFSAFSSC